MASKWPQVTPPMAFVVLAVLTVAVAAYGIITAPKCLESHVTVQHVNAYDYMTPVYIYVPSGEKGSRMVVAGWISHHVNAYDEQVTVCDQWGHGGR